MFIVHEPGVNLIKKLWNTLINLLLMYARNTTINAEKNEIDSVA
jgi:hypothetical protein